MFLRHSGLNPRDENGICMNQPYEKYYGI